MLLKSLIPPTLIVPLKQTQLQTQSKEKLINMQVSKHHPPLQHQKGSFRLNGILEFSNMMLQFIIYRGQQYQFVEGQYQYLQRAKVNTQYQYQYSKVLEVNTQYQYQYFFAKRSIPIPIPILAQSLILQHFYQQCATRFVKWEGNQQYRISKMVLLLPFSEISATLEGKQATFQLDFSINSVLDRY